MSTAMITPAMRTARRPVRPGGPQAGPAAGVRARTGRPPRSSGPSAGRPVRRPRRSAVLPGGHGDARRRVAADRPGHRGRAVLALMITVAAVAVIGLTAWQVTSADYSPATPAVGAAVSAR